MNQSYLRWSYVSTGSQAFMQLAAAATITRFLQPSDYGLAALALLCLSMTTYFTQLGVGRAIIQKPGITDGNIRAAFTLSVATGVAGFVILAALSPILGRYFREPRLPAVIVVFGLNLIFQSLGGVSSSLLRREFRIRDLAICDFLGYAISTFGIGLPMAMHGFGVWALVAGNVTQPPIVAVAYFIARPHPIRPTLKHEDYARITGFSAKASFTTIIEAVGGSMDMIVMGRILSPLAIGLYNRSLTLSMQPVYNISTGLTRVFHPTVARAAERSREECLNILTATERQLMSLIFPLCVGAAIAAPIIVPVVFGKQWISAVPVYQALCIGGALDATFHLPTLQLEIFSLFRHKCIVQGLFGICLGVAIFFIAPWGGIVAVAIAYAILQAFRTFGLHVVSARSLGVSALRLMRSWIPGLVCSTILAVCLVAAERGLKAANLSPSFWTLGALVLLSLTACVLVYRTFYRVSVYTQWLALFQR
jgi:O-antigen/teichoic acid export membrane protein